MRSTTMKTRRLLTIAMTVAVSGVVMFAPRPSYGAPLKNDNEFAGALAYQQGTGKFNNGSLHIDASYARYFTPWFNVGLRQGFVTSFRHNTTDRWLGTTYPSVEFLYNTRPDQVDVPYVNLGVGLAWNDQGSAGLVAPGAGLKFFLNEQTYIALGYNYLFLFNDVGNTFDNGINSVRAGFGFNWGGDRTATSSNKCN